MHFLQILFTREIIIFVLYLLYIFLFNHTNLDVNMNFNFIIVSYETIIYSIQLLCTHSFIWDHIGLVSLIKLLGIKV